MIFLRLDIREGIIEINSLIVNENISIIENNLNIIMILSQLFKKIELILCHYAFCECCVFKQLNRRMQVNIQRYVFWGYNLVEFFSDDLFRAFS
jgi:hypothetical protein